MSSRVGGAGVLCCAKLASNLSFLGSWQSEDMMLVLVKSMECVGST